MVSGPRVAAFCAFPSYSEFARRLPFGLHVGGRVRGARRCANLDVLQFGPVAVGVALLCSDPVLVDVVILNRGVGVLGSLGVANINVLLVAAEPALGALDAVSGGDADGRSSNEYGFGLTNLGCGYCRSITRGSNAWQ